MKIKSLFAREILDSRGEPTVELELETKDGIFFASVPSGASKGKYEAKELRDGDKRYFGKGVKIAIKNINEKIYPKIKGKSVLDQEEIDNFLIKLDGKSDKSNLGANAILPVSMAVCKAGARAKNLPLFKYIEEIFNTKDIKSGKKIKLPTPSFNIINGGLHGGNNLDIQEFMILPEIGNFSENLRAGAEIYHTLKEILIKTIGKEAKNIGEEGGFSPKIKDTKTALEFLVKSIKKAGYEEKVNIGLDCASSQFFKNGKYFFEGKERTGKEMISFYLNLIENFKIRFFEDPFAEDDFENWKNFLKVLQEKNKKIGVIGDDLITTNPERLKFAKENKLCNGIILKLNQIGTVSESLKVTKLAKKFGFEIIVSHRSGETTDDFISDLAVGIGADFIKAGAPARGERVAKYNRLLRIEEIIKQNY
ncbi:MAG: phosphopyruvate hydratase [Minisyncoccia bacterium]